MQSPSPSSPEQRLAQLEKMFRAAPVGLCFIDIDHRYVLVNDCFAALYGQPAAYFLGRTVRDALPAVAGQIIAQLDQALTTRSLVEIQLTVARSSPLGHEHPSDNRVYLRTAQPMSDATGTIFGFSVALMDITERERAESALRESEEHYRYTVELNPHIPWAADAKGNMTYVSPRYAMLTGLDSTPADRQAHAWSVHPEDRQATIQAWQTAIRSSVPYDSTYRMQCAGGDFRWMRARAFPRRGPSGEVLRWYGTLEDVHDRKLLDEALEFKNQRLEEMSRKLTLSTREDHLTGIANRRHFDDALQREYARARRSRQPLAIIMIDVDVFKRYNDTYGHPAGDACLRAVATTLGTVLRRQGDLAARYGGEEFVLLLPDTPEDGALAVAQHILDAIRALKMPHTGSPSGFLSVSGGLALFEPTAETLDASPAADIVKAADLALYAAKSAGRDCIVHARYLCNPTAAPLMPASL